MAPRVLVDATDVPADRGALGRYVDGLIGALDVPQIDVTFFEVANGITNTGVMGLGEVSHVASTAAVGLMKASRRSLVIDGGSDWPEYFCNAGLGSNRSIWLGPPVLNTKMQRLAFAA